MQKKISFIVNIIILFIAMCTPIYNTFFKRSIKREREYYNKILIPFVENLKSGNEDALQEVKSQIKYTDECIPKYILYLVDISQHQIDSTITDKKLSKVLIYDYMDIYPNNDNRMIRVARESMKVLVYLLLFLAFGFLIMGSISIAKFFDSLISSDTIKLFLLRLGPEEINTIVQRI